MIKHQPITTAAKLYSVLSPQVQCVPVQHEQFHHFHQALANLERRVRVEEITDDYLLTPIRRLRQYRFEACSVPLDFDSRFFWRKQSFDNLSEQLASCGLLYPDFVSLFQNVFSRLSALLRAPTQPLKIEVLRIFSTGGEPAVLLLPEARFVLPVRDALRGSSRYTRKLEVLSPAMLCGNEVYSRIVMIGPPRWYPEYVFSASRSASLEVVNFNWLQEEWKPKSVFGDLDDVTGQPSGSVVSTRVQLMPGWSRPVDILPAVANRQELTALVDDLERNNTDYNENETLDLRLFVLENGMGVFLEELDRAAIKVLDVADGPTIDTVSVMDVTPGAFLLLRTRGGGDYIPMLADRLMGAEAAPRRARQELWKAKLRASVKANGVKMTRVLMAQKSEQKVSSSQLRYWMWSGSIGPKKVSDFAAVLNLLDMDECCTQCQDDIERLRHFHQKAGQEITHQLLGLVQQVNLQDLLGTGITEFTLQEHDGGSITAIRVVGRTDIVVNLPARRARQLFDIEDRKWQD